MSGERKLFVLYQIGASEDWVWFSPIGVFLTEGELREFAREKGAPAQMRLLTPSAKNEITLAEPQDFVAVKTQPGELPEVDLEMEAQDRLSKEGRG